MEIRLRGTGEVVTEREFRDLMKIDPNTGNLRTLPNILLPEILDQLGADVVLIAPPPQVAYGQRVARNGAVQDALGNWVTGWSIINIPEEELASELSAAKDAKNREINQARLDANLSYFMYQGKKIACDTLSRSDIDATNGYIALFGALHPSWPGGWKAMDNTYVSISTVDEWKAFYTAMVDTGTQNFSYSQSLKTQLSNATTLESVASIVW